MVKRNGDKIPEDRQASFIEFINLGNARRMRIVLAALSLTQAFQLMLYMLKPGSYLHDNELMILKAVIIVLSTFFWGIFTLLLKGSRFLLKHGSLVVSAVIFVILSWSVVNTFKAQSITSDISIYLLAMFGCSAVLRIRPVTAAVIFGINYIFFAVGIPRFQTNEIYFTSHIMNGLILNVAAFLTTLMMYRLYRDEFLNKQAIDQKNRILLHMARHDGLTELYNHQTINELLEAAANGAEERREPLSIMLLDLDNFKELNDTFGHKAGDAVLKKASESILKRIRSGDMAGRYGGDEFLVILPGSGIEEARDVAMGVLNEFRSMEYRDSRLTFSCGIAGWDNETAAQLVEKADRNLYKVKNSGKNNISV